MLWKVTKGIILSLLLTALRLSALRIACFLKLNLHRRGYGPFEAERGLSRTPPY